MPIAVDRKRGRYKYTSEESPAPPGGVATEERIKGWFSKNPEYQNDLPEQPNYSEVVGDNQIHNVLAYQMEHTGRRFVRSRPGKPYGEIGHNAGQNVNIPAGSEVVLDSTTGYGWLTGFAFRIDYADLGINLYRDAKKIFNNIQLGQAYDDGVTVPMDNFIQVTRYDDTNNLYTGVWAPANPYYYSGKIKLSISNPDAVDHTVLMWSVLYFVNPR